MGDDILAKILRSTRFIKLSFLASAIRFYGSSISFVSIDIRFSNASTFKASIKSSKSSIIRSRNEHDSTRFNRTSS